MRFFGNADLGQQGHCLGLGLGRFALAHDPLCQGYVLQHGLVREQIEVLKYHPDFAAHQVEVGFALGQVDAVDNDLPVVEFFQAIEAAQKGGFARTGRADDHHHLTLADLRGHIVHRPYRFAATLEYLDQIFDFNHCERISVPARRATVKAARSRPDKAGRP